MHPEFLIPGLEDQHEEPFVGCLFCCQPFRWNYSRTKNVDSKFDLFCQAFHLTEDSFKAGLRMSPLCPNCLGLIQRIGKMLKRIQELETKLNLEKEAVINLLREEYGTLSSPEGQHPQNFSPVQFRGDIQKRLNVVPVCVTKEECPDSVGSSLEADDPYFPDCNDEFEDSGSLSLELASSFDINSLMDAPEKNREGRTMMTGGTEVGSSVNEDAEDFDDAKDVEEMDDAEDDEEIAKAEPMIKYSLPAEVVLKDCSIRLKKLRNLKREEMEVKERPRKVERKKGNRRKIASASGSPALEFEGEKRRKGGIRDRRWKRKDRVKGCNCLDAAEGKCSRRFSPEDRKLKEAHYKEVYLRRNGFCVECSLEFQNKMKLLKHRIQVHGEPYPIYCQEEGCGEGLLNERFLKEHMYIHTGDYPYRCDQCNTGYPNLFRLNDHKVTHVTTMDFICEVCGKAFKSAKILKQHYRAHSEDRPFKCEECDQAFKLLGGLKAHQHNVHSGERPFLCQDCGRSYKLKFNLDYHIRAKHSGPKPKKIKAPKKSSNSDSDLSSSLEGTMGS